MDSSCSCRCRHRAWEAFRKEHGVSVHQKLYELPSSAKLCQPTKALIKLLQSLPVKRYDVHTIGFPILCTFSLEYSASNVHITNKIEKLVRTNAAIDTSFEIQLSNKISQDKVSKAHNYETT